MATISAYREVFNPSSTHKRWLEKSTSSEIYMKHIFDWFPNAKTIHLIRDPRDNYSSLKSGWDKKYSTRTDDVRWLIQSMIDRGKLGMEFAKKNLKRYGDEHYILIKYEELTTHPKETINKICQFLEIEYNDSLLRPTVCGKLWKGNNFNGIEFAVPSTQNVGKWKERINDEEAKLIEYHFGELMKYFKYKTFYSEEECMDAATEHYKWYNYAQISKA